jgi:hypothetical protein
MYEELRTTDTGLANWISTVEAKRVIPKAPYAVLANKDKSNACKLDFGDKHQQEHPAPSSDKSTTTSDHSSVHLQSENDVSSAVAMFLADLNSNPIFS